MNGRGMTDMANENLIELKHVRKVFDEDTVVVEDFSLDIKKGEFVTFLGPSGCGKTTILRMLGGFDVPTGGEILLNGTATALVDFYVAAKVSSPTYNEDLINYKKI